jgi:hypothetical protein
MNSETKYMVFKELPSYARKTKIIQVISKSSGISLGEIKWYGPWRQYCFYPGIYTIFNNGCMTDIIKKIDELMQARKK